MSIEWLAEKGKTEKKSTIDKVITQELRNAASPEELRKIANVVRETKVVTDEQIDVYSSTVCKAILKGWIELMAHIHHLSELPDNYIGFAIQCEEMADVVEKNNAKND